MADADNQLSPSEVAQYLASCVAAIDSHARDPFTSDQMLYQASVARVVGDFLAGYQLAITRLVPEFLAFRRSEPVRHAGQSAASYHEVVCWLAREQYLAMLQRLNPRVLLGSVSGPEITGNEIDAVDVIDNWSIIAEDLAELFADIEPIDGDFLRSGIDTETKKTSALPVVESPNDDRDKWMYEQKKVAGKTHSQIRFAIARENAEWYSLGTDQAVGMAIDRYCSRHDLPLVRRKNET